MPHTNHKQIKKVLFAHTKKIYIIAVSIILFITAVVFMFILHGDLGLSESNLKFMKFEIENKGALEQSNLDDCAPECGMSQNEFEDRIGMKGKGSCDNTCLLNNGTTGDCNDARAFMPVGSICAYDVKVDGVRHTIIAHYTFWEGEGFIDKFSWHKK